MTAKQTEEKGEREALGAGASGWAAGRKRLVLSSRRQEVKPAADMAAVAC